MKSSEITIMISSQCKNHFMNDSNEKTLSSIRKELKKEIEPTKIFGKKLFKVWINEEEPAQEATFDSHEICLNIVKDCDILISLFNGHAGWAITQGDIGICHAELMTAIDNAPGKVRLIDLGYRNKANDSLEESRNQRFTEYVNSQNLFRGGDVSSIKDLKVQVKDAIYDTLIKLSKSGVYEASKGKYHGGKSLEWSRLNYKERYEAMCNVLVDSITKRTSLSTVKDKIIANLLGKEILFIPNAIPDSLSVSQAKEMVGQPFLKDHEQVVYISDDQGGPVHIIACHKSATEFQAKKLLGFPDATVVNAPFGIFVADNIQKVQFVFITNCRNESTTRHGVQRFFEWLEQNGEDKLLVNRALARARIIKLIAKENEN